MFMDRSPSSSSSSRESTSMLSSSRVLSIECIHGTSHADEWGGDLLQTGDIVDEIQTADSILRSPFRDGNSGVQKHLHSCFKKNHSSIRVRVRRGDSESAELTACIVPHGSKRHQYVLRAISDPNYAVAFYDRTESQCFQVQASRSSRLQYALTSAQLKDGYVSYPWEKKKKEMLQVPNSSCFLSILFLPRIKEQGDGSYDDLEETLARANAWLSAAVTSGVPIFCKTVQTESLLTKISGEAASSVVNTTSISDLPSIANTSLYGFVDYHGGDIGVVRSIRLWYSPIQGEYPVEMEIKESDVKLGFAIGRTEEGFIYIQSVAESSEDVPATRSNLDVLYKDAINDSKRLVISRVNNQKVLPWIVSSSGDIRCFDTISLSQKFSLHRHAHAPLLLHLIMWDQQFSSPGTESMVPLDTPAFPEESIQSHSNGDKNQLSSSSNGDESEIRHTRDTAGEESFRFHNFTLPDTWV